MSLRALPLEGGRASFRMTGARAAIVSWEAAAPIEIDLRVAVADGRVSPWLPYVRTDPWRSCSPVCDVARVEVDVIRSEFPIVAVEVRAPGASVAYVALPPLFTPSPATRALTRTGGGPALDVPRLSQYAGEHRGWCGPASLAMLMGYWANARGRSEWRRDVTTVAREIYDAAYEGTGNWTFATAYASARGLRAATTFLPDLEAARRAIAAGMPLALAIAWEAGELPGAPLPRSDGHLLALRGFDRAGDVLANDPAHEAIAVVYPRAAFERAWLGAGGAAYALAPDDLCAAFLGVFA